MTYSKPKLVATNNPQGSYAAGCPAKDHGEDYWQTGCKACERTK